MAWWLAQFPHRQKVPGWNSSWGCVLSVFFFFPPKSSGFLLQSKNWLTGDYKLTIGVCKGTHRCSSVCVPVMDCPCSTPIFHLQTAETDPSRSLWIGWNRSKWWMDAINKGLLGFGFILLKTLFEASKLNSNSFKLGHFWGSDLKITFVV